MRFLSLVLVAGCVAACAENPVVQQATADTRFDPTRADSMVSVTFAGNAPGPDSAQVGSLRAIVEKGRRAQRDEFVVVADGSGGAMQKLRAQRVGQALADAGARWVSTSVEPAMAMGPNTVVVVRSEYLLGFRDCPDFVPATSANPNEAAMPGFGCSNAYNMGQMLVRPRDAAVGRSPGPADGTVTAAAIARYRAGQVAPLNTTGIIGNTPVMTGTALGGGAAGAAGGTN